MLSESLAIIEDGSFLWLFFLLVVLCFWGKTVWGGLNPAQPESFERTIRWLKQGNVGQLYLDIIGLFIDKLSDWIGDRRYMNQAYMSLSKENTNNFCYRLFGFNPFTPISFEKCLTLSLIYPLLAFLLAWGLGTGQTANVETFWYEHGVINTLERFLQLGIMMLSMGGGLWLLMRWRGPRRWLLLAAMFALWSVVIMLFYKSVFDGKPLPDSYLALFGMFWLLFLCFFVPAYIGGFLIAWKMFRSSAVVHELIYSKAIAAAIIFTFVVVVTSVAVVTGKYSIAVAGTVAIAVALSATIIAAVGVTGAIFVAVVLDKPLGNLKSVGQLITGSSGEQVTFGIMIVAFAVGVAIVLFEVLYKRNLRRKTAGWFWFVYCLLFICLAYLALHFVKEEFYHSWILFWLLLPLVNAPLNWMSLGIARGLLQAVRAGHHSGLSALVWAIVDLLLAMAFLFFISAIIIFATELANTVAQKPFINVSDLLKKVEVSETKADDRWIYFMVLSALIPTLVHFALVGGAATLLLPRNVRLWLTKDLATDKHKMSLAWVYITFIPVIGFFLVPAGLLFSLWYLMSEGEGMLGGLLLDWARGMIGLMSFL